jgi:hypothetical protein
MWRHALMGILAVTTVLGFSVGLLGLLHGIRGHGSEWRHPFMERVAETCARAAVDVAHEQEALRSRSAPPPPAPPAAPAAQGSPQVWVIAPSAPWFGAPTSVPVVGTTAPAPGQPPAPPRP